MKIEVEIRYKIMILLYMICSFSLIFPLEKAQSIYPPLQDVNVSYSEAQGTVTLRIYDPGDKSWHEKQYGGLYELGYTPQNNWGIVSWGSVDLDFTAVVYDPYYHDFVDGKEYIYDNMFNFANRNGVVSFEDRDNWGSSTIYGFTYDFNENSWVYLKNWPIGSIKGVINQDGVISYYSYEDFTSTYWVYFSI